MTHQTLTPADLGTIAVTLDDCRQMGLGDDDSVNQVYFALTSECGFSRSDAEHHAYHAIHS